MRLVLILVVLVLIVALTAPRMLPVDLERAHQSADRAPVGAYPRTDGYAEVREIATTPERLLLRLDDIARATPRTRLVAGSLADEKLTYETRSRIFGFPDYTTVEIITDDDGNGHLVQINGRLRFGRSDLGVNRARVTDWFDQLGLLTVTP